jgi:hypothetical protein
MQPRITPAPLFNERQLKGAGFSNQGGGWAPVPRVPLDAVNLFTAPEHLTADEVLRPELPDEHKPLLDTVGDERIIRATTVNFHFTGETAGGFADNETRTYGPIPNAFRIKSIEVSPISGVVQGQFLDIFISDDADFTDVARPTGNSIFPRVLNWQNLPNNDGRNEMQIPLQTLDIPMAHLVRNAHKTIKAKLFYSAPALALPVIEVTLVIHEVSFGPFADTTPPLPTPTPDEPLRPLVEVAEEPAPRPAPPPTTTDRPRPPEIKQWGDYRLTIGSPMYGVGQYGNGDDLWARILKATDAGRLVTVHEAGQVIWHEDGHI